MTPPPLPPPAPTPTLPDDLLEEIFLRLPPDEPACLVRASLASKPWLGLLAGAAFRGRYRDFHGAPPMLGFLLSWLSVLDWEKHPAPHFVSTAEFGARVPDKSDWWHKYESLDCRHGRILAGDTYLGPTQLSVWDPITGCRRDLGSPREFLGLGAAVLCAVTGCNHHACHRGPFRVLLFGVSMDGHGSAQVWEWSSETGEWSEPCPGLYLGSDNAFVKPMPSVLYENALYHIVIYPHHMEILKYDMGSNCLSLFHAPPGVVIGNSPILMKMEDGSLGFAYSDGLTLCLCSAETYSDGFAAWTHCRVLDLKGLLPIQNPKKRLKLIGSKEDTSIIFVITDLGIYEFNLKSLEWKKLWKREKIRALIPYMSFYNPPERATNL